MLRFLKLATALAVVPIIAFAAPALAVGEGQIESGDIYRIKNITKNIDFVDPANADSCNLLEYKVRIHDPGPGFLTNVNVWVDLPSGADTNNISTIVVSAQNANPLSTFDTATLNLSSAQGVSYVNGTTQLLDASGNVIQNLPDGITQAGIAIGNVGVSFNNRKYVQFQARVSCPAPVPTPTPTPTPTPAAPTKPTTKPVVTVASSTKALPDTGPGDVAAIFAGVSAIAGAGHYFVTRRLRA
ncbi:MAG: hypothetical protein AAB541_03810 [Patescibacteria group bacterium]